MRSYPRTTFEIDDPNLPKQSTNKHTQKQSESITSKEDDNNANQKQ